MERQIRRSRASPELGEGDFAINYNARTGRPMRKARRVTEGSPFVDSAVAVSDAEDSDDSDSSIALASRPRKRKRSPSLAASIVSDADKIVSNSDASVDTSVTCSTVQAGMQLTIKNMIINVPPGHTGPLLLQLDIPSQTLMQPAVTEDSSQATSQHSDPVTDASTETAQYAGFLDLPAELRNEIYRQVFVSDDCFNFDSPRNFSRSAAFLRTCKQVYNEARSILYSENHFLFVRKTRRHGSYWEREWNEVGFKAVRKFLHLIGPENTALIRDATLLLEDATPCLNPGMTTADERRFVFDEVLMSCLKMLAQASKLRKLHLHFRGTCPYCTARKHALTWSVGRRRVERTDHRFLEKLTAIQADEVKFIRTPPGCAYPTDSKQEHSVEKMCLSAMVRKRKIFK
jgi:hypothetical protein